MSPSPTSDFTDLVLHVLAHVRLGGPGCLYDPRYVAWARGRAPAELEHMLGEDAAVLGQAWAMREESMAPASVHAWPELFGSIAELRAHAALELRALSPSQVRDAGVLARLQREAWPDLELLHATLCVLAPWYAGWRAEEVEPALRFGAIAVQRWLEPAVRVLPSLASARIELAWALGPHGRGFPSRIVVGAPAPWHGFDERISLVIAMHEQAVIDSGQDGYVEAEWAALTGLAARMTAAVEPLRQAHVRWLGALELRPLLASLHEAGRLSAEERLALERDPDSRAARLAALAG